LALKERNIQAMKSRKDKTAATADRERAIVVEISQKTIAKPSKRKRKKTSGSFICFKCEKRFFIKSELLEHSKEHCKKRLISGGLLL
jgi:hypothetical protein